MIYVRGHNNGAIVIDYSEIENGYVSGMSVYGGKTEEEAVKYLRYSRSQVKGYGRAKEGHLNSLKNFSIKEDSVGNKGHYLISGITVKQAINAFSTVGEL